LLVFDPANDLIPIKDQSAAGPEPEMWQSAWNGGLSYGPGRAADEFGHGPDIEWLPEAGAGAPGNGLVRRTAGQVALCNALGSIAGRRLPKMAEMRGFKRLAYPGLRSGSELRLIREFGGLVSMVVSVERWNNREISRRRK